MQRALLRCGLLTLVLLALAIGGTSWWRWRVRASGQEQLAEVTSALDARDPRWRWDDLEAELPVLGDEENASRLVAEFRTTVGVDRRFSIHFPENQDPIHLPNGADRNHLPTPAASALIDAELRGTEVAWPTIKRLANTPLGRRTLLPAAAWTQRKPPDEERPEPVLRYLEWEAERSAGANAPGRQGAIVRAYLNVVRIEAIYPFVGGPLGRHYALSQWAWLVERLLALDALPGALSWLQSEVAAEAEVERFRPAARLTRAEYDETFKGFKSGEVSLMEHLVYRSNDPRMQDIAEVWLYQPHLEADWAEAVRFATAVLPVADLPDHTRLMAFAAVPTPPQDGRHPFSCGCARNLHTLLESSLRIRALLRSTVTALAVERHRRLTGEWPETLDAIPKAILPAVPADPFTGNPLTYARRPDGVTVAASDPRTAFRLYDPGHRRLPPLPPLPAPNDD